MVNNMVNLALIAGLSNFNIVDLTHAINETTQVWDGSCGFISELTSDYGTNGFRGQEFTMRSCVGTHIDSPAHCVKGAADCSQLDINNCIAPAYVIDVTQKAHEDYCISLEDIDEFENTYGQIKSKSVVFFATGWSKRWGNSVGQNFPYIAEEVAQLLVERDILGIGVETLSPDNFNSKFPVHKILLGAGKYIIENVANLGAMPAVNSFVVVLPLKINGAVESPIRLIGLVPN